ncbi:MULTISPECIES: hypothetical protein [Rhizobium]|uniref:hypothetical protein n=1 Tax=Rhizobium TaxID=379 RepID=UPI00235F7399|nr:MULTISPECIES: hypothetical protein [unclassified Rhizobium]MDC9808714.1 hypothetical protein [Rhizobium sp. MC62]WEA25740.1 hypothetical protein PO862_22420 [Rhizobium sp. MJ22]
MNGQSARVTIVIYSLVLTASIMIFLALSQVIGMRFDYAKQENLRLIDIVLPTFLAYLGAASHFIFNSNAGRDVGEGNGAILRVLVHAPFWIFGLFTASLFFVHYKTHLPLPDDAPRVQPLTYDTLSRYLSVGLGVLAATVSILSSYLFGAAPKVTEPSPKPEVQ